MSTSVQQNPQGPVWPLGSVVVASPGTPVRITSVVDPNNVNAPETATTSQSDEYTRRCYGIFFQAYKAGGSHGLAVNTGNIYIIQKGGAGSNNRDDTGSILFVLLPGQTWTLDCAALNRNALTPYQYYIDADNANDAAQVTLLIQ